MSENKIGASFKNLDKAFASLKEFIAEPIVSRRNEGIRKTC